MFPFRIQKTIVIEENREKAPLIAQKLGIALEARLLRNVDVRTVLRSIISSWLPLGPAIFRTLVEICPSPLNAIDALRARYMLFGEHVGELAADSDAPFIFDDDDGDDDEDVESDRKESENEPLLSPAISGELC